jgi:cytochrome b561
MSDITEARIQLRSDSRAKSGRFDKVSIILHWLTAVLVAAQLTTASLMSQDTPVLLTIHRSTGLTIWAVVVARLIWRSRFAYLPPFPDSMRKVQQRTAKIVEYILYLLLLVQPITGLSYVIFHGRPFMLFAWQVPALLAPNQPVFQMFHTLHELGAAALLTVAGFHAAAALFHGLVLRDGVLQRMLIGSDR